MEAIERLDWSDTEYWMPLQASYDPPGEAQAGGVKTHGHFDAGGEQL